MAPLSTFGIYWSVLLLTLTNAGELDNKYEDGNTITNMEPMEKSVLADSINGFGYKLMTEIMKNCNDENVIISPAGIAGLLAMTLLGSVGRSYDELADALGFSQDVRINSKNHEEFGDLLRCLNANTSTSQTLYADAVFINERSRLRPLYTSYLSRVYNGEAINVNFLDGPTTKDLINLWVSNHTNNKIQDFIKEPLPTATQAVLLSALYFSGQWLHPFLPEYTAKMPFKRPKDSIDVDLMLNAGKFKHVFSVENGFQMISLPYNDSLTSFYILKPLRPENTSLTEILQRIDYLTLNKFIEQMSMTAAVLRFPKFELHATSRLEDALKAIGIRSIFMPDVANFALMIEKNNTDPQLLSRFNVDEDLPEESKRVRDLINGLPNPGVHVDSILHDVKLTINEYGTEAVAATSGILARSAVLFYVDSPFYIFIRNEITKLVTFSAIIKDPTSPQASS